MRSPVASARPRPAAALAVLVAASLLAPAAVADPPARASVTLSGRVAAGPAAHRSAAFVAVELPLDAPLRSAPAAAAARTAPGAGRLARHRGPVLARGAAAVGPRVAPFPDGAFARAAVRAAWRAAGLSHDRRLDDLAGRARLAATLPELSLGVERTTDESLRLTPTLDDPYRHTQAGGESITLEGRLRWRLDRVMFADEELALERVRADRARLRAELARRVIEALVRWVRAVRAVEQAAGAGLAAADDPALAEAEVGLLEAELALDALTGGWFERQKHRRRH